MQNTSGGDESLKTVERTFQVIELLYRRGEMGVSELAEDLDIAKSTAHRYLSTLEREEYLVPNKNKYRLSLNFLRLGGYTQYQNKFYSLADKKTRELAERTGERAQFVVEEHGYAIYVHTHAGENAVQVALPVKLTKENRRSVVGKRLPLHCISAGKSILAKLSDERVREIVDERGLDPVTENTITELDELMEVLKGIEERGYSINKEEGTLGLRAVGVALTGPDGAPIGAISVAGPTHRLKGTYFEDEIPNLLKGVVNEIKLESKYL